MQRILLVGDSHLAFMHKPRQLAFEERAGDVEIYNAAVGGFVVHDVRARCATLAALEPDAVVVSLGSNDAAPWNAVPLDVFEAELRVVLEQFAPARRIVMAAPPCVEARLPNEIDRTNHVLREFAGAASAACAATGAVDLGLHQLTLDAMAAGRDVHEPDGLHFNDAGYELISDALAAALR